MVIGIHNVLKEKELLYMSRALSLLNNVVHLLDSELWI